MVLRIMSHLYADNMVAAHFNMFHTPDSPADANSGLSTTEKRLLERRKSFAESGRGYFNIQSTKPFTIGIAIGSSPLAVLAYIGEKTYSWSDPARVDPMDIIDTVALYFLSGSFATSVVIYNQVSFGRMKPLPQVMSSNASCILGPKTAPGIDFASCFC